MFFLKPRNVQCPECKQNFFVDFTGTPENQAALKYGSPFVCPNCNAHSNYPRYADWIFGAGLAVAVVLMPIEYNTQLLGVSMVTLAVIATGLVIVGSALRRLKKVP
jgi:hypothetical protein